MIFGSGTKKPAPIVLVLALSLILNLTAVWWGLPNSWSWAPDEILPYQVQEGMAAHFSGGWFSKYPLIHYYLLSLLFLPFPALQKWGLIDTNTLAGYSTFMLAAAFLGKPKNRILLALLLFGLGYFLSFICVIRYTYDRYTLPLCLLLSFFAGKALSDFVEGSRAILRTAVVVLILGSALVSAIAVDRLMLKDSRYTVEAWMRSNIAQGATVLAATPGEYLPRLDAYKPVFLEDPSLPDIDRDPQTDYVIYATPFRRSYEASHPGNRFFSKFFERPPGYRLAFRYQTKLALAPLQIDGIATNLAAINPEIQIYERSDLSPLGKK